MPKEDIYLSVIVPTYNEEERIEKTLRRLHEYLSQKPFTYEILVTLDGGTDGTADIVKRLEGEIPKLQLLHRKENKGKGYAVAGGMLAAKGKIRLFTDADNSTDIEYFEQMRPLFDRGYDVVISSRHPWDAPGAAQRVSQPFYKRILGMAGNLFIQIVAVRGIWDTQNGFKAFRDHAAEKIFSQIHIYRWGFDIEVLALAKALRYKLGIIGIQWIDDQRSHVKLSSYFQVLWETVKVRWYFIRGKYEL